MVFLDWKAIVGVLGALLVVLGVALLVPAAVGLAYGEPAWQSFAATAAGALGAGAAAWSLLRPEDELNAREGFLIVSLAWLVLSLVGALPWVLAGLVPTFADAFFETMSGFTTTGATILSGATTPAIEDVPRAFLLWRSLTHWLGGMGIILLTLAVLPLLGVGAMQLFRAEVPGLEADKLTPRVAGTAVRLWGIYAALTLLQTLSLLPAMSPFEAVNHAFATLATGGFSTRNGSVGDFGSAYVEWVVTAFMVLAGINFSLHYALLHGRVRAVLAASELRVYLALALGATLVVAAALWAAATPGTDALRLAAFQVVAILTTTGFGTADYELWPPLAAGVLFLLFFAGGMAGSTAGGVKVLRHMLLSRLAVRELRALVHPQAVLPLRHDGRVVPEAVARAVLAFAVLYAGLVLAGTLGLTLLGQDVLGAFTAAASCVGNIGPAFGTFGPAETYTHLPAAGKWLLALLMMAGRLEIFTVLVLFSPGFWRR
ncbi:MAG: TrkH family potassium uptake protein [Rubricoccaceae bacterium]